MLLFRILYECFTLIFVIFRIIIYCWQSGKGPDSRIELKGLYPGALVNLSLEWPYGREVIINNIVAHQK